jgi:hypothetical protein
MVNKIDKYDFYCENFETYFRDRMEGITAAQKALLPQDIKNKLFRGKEKLNNLLSFKEKVYILSTCFGSKVQIYVYDEDKEFRDKDYSAITKSQGGDLTHSELLETPHVKAGFIMSDKILHQAITYMSHIYTSKIYTLLRPINVFKRTRKEVKIIRAKEVITFITEIILKHEQYKKSVMMEFNLTPQKLYSLLYFANGEKFGKDFFNRDFTHAFNCNARRLQGTVKTMYDEGLLHRRGINTAYKYTLTSKGHTILQGVISKILDNYLK